MIPCSLELASKRKRGVMDELEKEQMEELRHLVFHKDAMEKERALSDSRYADKIVEKIVFGMITLILVAVIGAIISLVVR